MLQALDEAQRGLGFCAPNPAVGAVVVRNGQVIAAGYHHGPGLPHAEVEALRELELQPQDALYVTLEPCCHHGRTPPCTDLIIRKRCRTVYFGFFDPNPDVAGKGQQLLQQAGIDCQYLPLDEVAHFYQPYHYWWREQRPWVTVKLAISDQRGVPVKALTNLQCQHYTHQQRLHSDALLTTVNTIVHDDPQLNARLIDHALKKPLYILDREARMPLSARVFETCTPITVFYHQASDERVMQLQQAGVRCLQLPAKVDGLDLEAALLQIGRDGCQRLWVEAGPTCFASLVRQGFAHEIMLYVAPHDTSHETLPLPTVYEPGFQREISIESFGNNLIIRLTP